MITCIFKLKSKIPLPANPARYEEHAHDLAIIVKTDCLGRAKRTCSDIRVALDHGAVPAAQSVICSHISDANTKNLPLACKLEYTL